MAPILEVKSDSWLDLSASAQANEPKLDQGSRPKFERSQRHSMSDYYSALEAVARRKEASASNNQQAHHLLIRMRQHSYLNRSSASLASNLSNSIKLSPSLLGYNSSSELSAEEPSWRHRQQEEPARGVHEQRPLLKGQSRGLQELRQRLERGQSRLPVERGSAEQATRSWSSLSERISGKLSHLRHSWKHFLYAYNQATRLPKEERSPSCAPLGQQAHLDAAVDRRELTRQWVARSRRCQQQQLADR